MSFIVTPRNVSWHYEICGQGECLLFLHGWASNSRVFSQQKEFFSKDHQVLTVDLPGHGETSWQPISFSEIAQDIHYILETLNIASASLVGSSMGGLIGLKFSLAFPNNVHRLVLIGSLPKFCRTPEIPLGLHPGQFLKLKDQVQKQYPNILEVFFRSLFTIEERETEKFRWLQQFRKNEKIPDQKALLGFLDQLERENLLFLVKDISVPIQFISGQEDYICPVDSVAFLKTIMPQAEFHFIQKSGHFPFIIRSAEFNMLVKEFLERSE